MARSLRPIDVYPITVRTLEVLRVTDVSPGMRRVTVGGPELAAHTAANGYPVAAFRSEGFDDEGKLILKHPDAQDIITPTQADGVLNWPRGHEHLLFRTYTIRRWDPIAGEIDLDFVKHGVGPATTWAYRVQPGETIRWAGPKSSAHHPQDVDWTLVAGDETALPAIGRWLEEWPAGARGQVFIEVAEDTHRQDLPVPEGVELTWLSRDGAEAGTTTLLYDAITTTAWWEGKVFAWVAGEALSLTPIRRWLRNDKGLAKEQVEVTGYWRRQEVVVSQMDAALPDLEASQPDGEVFHELTELMPGFALRVAATIGLGRAFAQRTATLDDLARTTGADPVGLSKLLRYLVAIDVVEALDAQHYQLTGIGRELEDDDTAEELNLDGYWGQEELGALLSLLEAVRTGNGQPERFFGTPFRTHVQDHHDLLVEHLELDAEFAQYAAGALVAAPEFAELGRVTVAGRGPVVFADALLQAAPDTRVSVLAAPSEIAVLQTIHQDATDIEYVPGSLLSPLPTVPDAVLLTKTLEALPDADVAHALATCAQAISRGGKLLVFTKVLDTQLSHEHDYEHDLVDFALYRGGARTHEEYCSLFAQAGLNKPARRTIGWGNTLYSVTV